MAETTFGTNDAQTVKRWAMDLDREALARTLAMRWASEDEGSPLQVRTELNKGAGDTVYTTLRMQGSGLGRQGDDTLEGHEEALTTHRFSLIIDQLRHAFKSGGRMSEQRVNWNVRRELRDAAADWYANRLDEAFFFHACGYTASTDENGDTVDTRRTGNTTVVAPSTNHHRWATGAADETVQAASTAVLTPALVDKAVNKAQVISPIMRPLKIGGRDHYIWVMHPNDVPNLRLTGGDWMTTMQNAIAGGKVDDNPIFTGALGMWNNVIFHVDKRIPNGLHSSTGALQTSTRRNVMLGAQAVMLGYGQENGPSRFTWVEALSKYKNKYGIGVGSIFGMGKCIYDSEDYGTMVTTTYAAAP